MTAMRKAIAGLWIAVAVGYGIWGLIYERGLVGWINDQLIVNFGSTIDERLAVALAIAVASIPAAIIYPWSAKFAEPKPVSYGAAAAIGLAPALIGGAVYLWLTNGYVPESQLVLKPIAADSSERPAGGDLVRLDGVELHMDRAQLFEKTKGSDVTESRLYVPVAAAGAWELGEVRYVAAFQMNGKLQGSVAGPEPMQFFDFSEPEMRERGPFAGIAERDGLPSFAKNAFERDGVKFAEPYWVVSHRFLSEGRIMGGDEFPPWLALALGGGLSALLVPLMLLTAWRQRRDQARKARA